MEERSVAELVVGAKAGDRQAMEDLLAAVAPQVERFGRRLCGAASPDVDDALQDALLAIATHLPSFEGRSSFSSWVFTLVRSACHRRRRGLAARPHDAIDDSHVDPAASPEASAAAAERLRLIERALDALPEEHREVLALRDVEGLTAEEAADVLGIGVPALKSRLHRARHSLRAALAPVLAPSSVAPGASCPDVLGALSAKLEDDLAPEACTLLEQHVAGCDACGALCDSMRGAVGLCRELGEGRGDEAKLREHVRRALVRAGATAGRAPS